MNVIRKKREFFFGPSGSNYKKFSSLNRPNEASFRRLFYSIPFFMEPESTAKTSSQGLVRLSSDDEAFDRNTISSDGYSRAVQPHQLPSIKRKDIAENILYLETAKDSENRNGGKGPSIKLASYKFVGAGIGIAIDHETKQIKFTAQPIDSGTVNTYIDDALQNYMTNNEVGDAFVNTSTFNSAISGINDEITAIKELQGNFGNVPSALGNTVSKAIISLNSSLNGVSQKANQNEQAILGQGQSLSQLNTTLNELLQNQADVSNFETRLYDVETKAIPQSVWQNYAGNVSKMFRAFTEHYFTHYNEVSTTNDNWLLKSVTIPEGLANNMDMIHVVVDVTFEAASNANTLEVIIEQGENIHTFSFDDGNISTQQILELWLEFDEHGDVLYYAYRQRKNEGNVLKYTGKNTYIDLSQEFKIRLVSDVSDATKSITVGRFLASVQHRPSSATGDINVELPDQGYNPPAM